MSSSVQSRATQIFAILSIDTGSSSTNMASMFWLIPATQLIQYTTETPFLQWKKRGRQGTIPCLPPLSKVLPRPPCAVQLQILFPPFKVVNPGNVIQYTVIADNLRRRYVRPVWQDTGAVFTNMTGGYIVGANLNSKLKRVCEKAGLPSIHLHPLRHTHASLLINSNITAKVIADRLGHSTTKTTLDTYSHVFAESEARAATAIDMALFRKTNWKKAKKEPLRAVKICRLFVA